MTPMQVDAVVELATKRFRDALHHMLSTKSCAHAFDLGREPTGEMYSLLIIMAPRDDIDATLAGLSGGPAVGLSLDKTPS